MHVKEEEKMPRVKKNRNAGGMKFPYTSEGMAQAKAYSMATGGKVQMDSYEVGGMVKQYMGGGMVGNMMNPKNMAMSKMMYGGPVGMKKKKKK